MNSPFNEAKYKALLEGLEVSEVNFKELSINNDRFRFDSEFVKKEYLFIEKKLENKVNKRLSDVDCEIIHPKEIKREYVLHNGVWFFRAQNIRPLKILHSNDVFISKADAKKLKDNIIKKYDVVITRTGANFGQTALFNIDEEAIASSHTFILRNNYFRQAYIAVFFNTKYGRKLIDKGMYGGSQPEIAPYYLSNIPIPDFTNHFQTQIEKILILSENKQLQSQQTYTQAEEILLEELGLKDFEPSNEPVNIKSFKDSFLANGRLDAEYYQKKYEDYIKLIKNYKHGFEPFLTACNLKDKNFTPDEAKQYKYIELANIGKTGDINGCTVSLGKDLPTRARRIVSENDVIISSIEGSLDSCALITKEYDKALCSTGFYVINSDKINSETLLILFKSKPMQNILKKSCSGTILTAINKTELENIPVPLIDYTKQQQIAELIEESFALKKQSEELLETAKRAVEIAIEEDEENAMKYINSKVS